MDMCRKFEDFVNVSVRIKPSPEDACLKVISKEPPVLLVRDRSQTYHFDNIFANEDTQKDVYDETVKPLVEHVKSGYNCTVFAYGQTGTGKTYTMGTNPDVQNKDDFGLISRTLEDLFVSNNEEEAEILISFIEIYNEKVFDLLADKKNPLPVKGFTVQGFEKRLIHNTCNAMALLRAGGRNRHTGGTKQNFNSSRSHAIFTIYCHTWDSESERMAKLNLVDLAGSESVRKTGNQGSSFHEGININKGLLSLGQVMTALSTNSSYVPYRQSIITTILQDSLNKKNFISLIACVSPHLEDLGETLQTLEFSQRVKKMKNKPEVNLVISQYKKDNPMSFPQCPPRGVTPAKRSNSNVYETPFKKSKPFLPIIQEPNITSHSNLEISPKSMLSSSVSSVASDLQQNLSPVIKKYMNAMENSIMAKLEDVIKNTLKRPVVSVYHDNKENSSTPSFPWDKVTKVVRSEILQFSSQISRGTSSPIENCTLLENSFTLSPQDRPVLKPRKMLTYDDSPLQTEQTSGNNVDEDIVFKVPAPVKKRRVKALNSPVKRRSSIRLQKKQQTPEIQAENASGRRRSVRLQLKADLLNGTVTEDAESVAHKRGKKRKSAGSDNPCPNCLKKPRQKNTEDSPITRRTKQVLNILNTGSLKEIESLHTIGVKTAEKIHLLRTLKGPFNSISDLCEMPSWTKRKHDKFLADNFLRHENNNEVPIIN